MSIAYTERRWHLWTESGSRFEVMTCLDATASASGGSVEGLGLLRRLENRALLESVVYEPSLACLLVRKSLVWFLHRLSFLEGGPVSWIADHDQKWGLAAGITLALTVDFACQSCLCPTGMVARRCKCCARTIGCDQSMAGSEVSIGGVIDGSTHLLKTHFPCHIIEMQSVPVDSWRCFQSSRIESAALSSLVQRKDFTSLDLT